MKKQKTIYRKNFTLILILLIFISITFVISLVISYNLTFKYVENEFTSKKIDVLEQTIRPYNDFFQNRIPQITSYQGFLDSSSAAKFADTVFRDYSFVNRIIFYDLKIENQQFIDQTSAHLAISIKSVSQFLPKIAGTKKIYNSLKIDESDFTQMAAKINDYITFSDTIHGLTPDEIFRTFYDIKPNKITFSNILSREDVKTFREVEEKGTPGLISRQNMMTFYLDPLLLRIRNPHPELYQNISIQPLYYDKLDNNSDIIVAEVPLSGAFSEYKLYLNSQRDFINAGAKRRFLPIGALLLVIYSFLLLVGWLIYRNMNVNIKLFKLQYDFINNFTHEFKTPVSVIKIAGSNLSGDSELSERQRKKYGRILNEEADKLNDLMNKLLSFTQLENKSIRLKKEEIDLEVFVSKYIETFKLKYPDFKIELRINNTKTFFADPLFLSSIFQNLIDNAYKYSHPQQKELIIAIKQQKRNVIFTFTDKGIGIQKSELNNIFKKFYRVENQYNQNGSVGLGLAFCKELVNFMDGEISVKSRVNEGSEFIVTLPYEN